MTEPAFLTLTALVGSPRHGYGLLAEIRDLSDGRVEMKVGTLYGLLDRLVGEGLVGRDREEVHQGRRRRYYHLTEDGQAALETEVARQRANARAAAARLARLHLAPGGAL